MTNYVARNTDTGRYSRQNTSPARRDLADEARRENREREAREERELIFAARRTR